jgi:hypothetical protein
MGYSRFDFQYYSKHSAKPPFYLAKQGRVFSTGRAVGHIGETRPYITPSITDSLTLQKTSFLSTMPFQVHAFALESCVSGKHSSYLLWVKRHSFFRFRKIFYSKIRSVSQALLSSAYLAYFMRLAVRSLILIKPRSASLKTRKENNRSVRQEGYTFSL